MGSSIRARRAAWLPQTIHEHDDEDDQNGSSDVRQNGRKPGQLCSMFLRLHLRIRKLHRRPLNMVFALLLTLWLITFRHMALTFLQEAVDTSAAPIPPINVQSGFALTLSHRGQKKKQVILLPLVALNESVREPLYSRQDFGELDIRIFLEDEASRNIIRDFREDQADQEETDSSSGDYYYAFDDDVKRNPYIGWHDDTIQNEKHCRRTNWHRDLPINCNSFHELGIASNALPNMKFVAEGAFKIVYRMKNEDLIHGQHERFVFKAYYYEKDYEYTYKDLEWTRVDALVSDRLSSSPRIANNYGYCGFSILSEYFPYGDLLHRDGVRRRYNKVVLNDKDDVDPQNKYTIAQKLKYALEMAESLAELHGFKGGVIAHDDIKPVQWLFTSDDHLVLNDFNRAEVMLWDEANQEYCKYRNGRGRGTWRSPEEYNNYPLNEQMDVYSYGFSLYYLLTGHLPFHNTTLEDEDVQRLIRHEKTPYIDPRYRNRSLEEKELANIIDSCLVYKPEKRADIFQIVRRLRKIFTRSKRL